MGFLNKKFGVLIIILLITTIGYSQENQKIDKFLISPPEMTSTSGVFIDFKEKGDYFFQITKETETVFSKELIKVDKVSFKIDFSNFNLGTYQIIIKDKNDIVLYDKQIIKE